MSHDKELQLENLRMNWREEAKERALGEGKARGLHGEKLSAFVEEHAAVIYAELEKIGLENIT